MEALVGYDFGGGAGGRFRTVPVCAAPPENGCTERELCRIALSSSGMQAGLTHGASQQGGLRTMRRGQRGSRQWQNWVTGKGRTRGGRILSILTRTPTPEASSPIYRGTSLIRNCSPPWDPPMTLGIGLR